MNLRSAILGCLVVCVTAGCSGSGGSSSGPAGSGGTTATGVPPDLSKSVVTTLPAGDGSGTSFSGTVMLNLRTLSCAGHCGPVPGPFDLQASYCDVGEMDSESWDLVQLDGRLSTDVNMDVDMHLEGGVGKDGHFEIGGWGTEMAGSVEGTARASGTLVLDQSGSTPKPRIESGTFGMYSVGVDNGVAIDCLARYEILPP